MTLEAWGRWAALAAAAEGLLGSAGLSDREVFRLQKLAHELGPVKGLQAVTFLLAFVLEEALVEVGNHGSVLDLPLRALALWEG